MTHLRQFRYLKISRQFIRGDNLEEGCFLSGTTRIPLRTAGQHSNKSDYHKQFGDSLIQQNSHLDWGIIVLFHAAMHKVNAFLSRHRNMLGQTLYHPERGNLVATDTALTSISIEYEFLYTLMRSLRYDPSYSPPPNSANQAQTFMTRIKNHIDPLL